MGQDKNGERIAPGDKVILTATVEQLADDGSVFIRTTDGDLRVNVWGKCVQKVKEEVKTLEEEVKKVEGKIKDAVKKAV